MKARYIFTIIPAVFLVLLMLTGCSAQEATVPETDNTVDEPFVQGEWKPDGVIGSNEYESTLQLSKFIIRYSTDDQYLYLAMEAPTEGWISVGFVPSADTGMQDADLIFAAVENGNARILDEFSTGKFGPHGPDVDLGGTDDIEAVGGSEADGVTIIEFKRKLVTGDAYDLMFDPDATTMIIAYSNSDDFTRQHTFRGLLN